MLVKMVADKASSFVQGEPELSPQGFEELMMEESGDLSVVLTENTVQVFLQDSVSSMQAAREEYLAVSVD